jgi:hypothetical protein
LKGINAFFDIGNSDPFKALSIDRMHTCSHGLGGKHIWPVLQEYIEACGRENMKAIDERCEYLIRFLYILIQRYH